MSLKTTAPEAEARLVRFYFDPQTSTIRLIRKWTDIDATVAKTVTAGLPASVSSPKADGQTYVGDFQVNQNIAEGQDDRSVTITQTLIKQGNVISITYVENCDSHVELQYYFGLSITDAQAKIEEFDESVEGQTVTPRLFPINENEVNLLLEIKTTQTRQPVINESVEVSPSGTTTETQVLGWTEESNVVIPALAPAEQGKIKRRDIRALSDCAKNITDQTEQPTNQTSQDKLDTEDRTVVTDKNTEKTTQETVSSDANRAEGTYERVSNTPTRAGNWSTAKEIHTVKNRVTSTVVERADYTEAVENNSAASAQAAVTIDPDTVPADKFKVQTVTNRETDFKNRWETQESTRTYANQTSNSYDFDRTEERRTVRQTQTDQPDEPNSVTEGRRVIIATPTETHKFDVQDITETPIRFDTDWYSIATLYGQAYRRTILNATYSDYTGFTWPDNTSNHERSFTMEPQNNGRYRISAAAVPNTAGASGGLAAVDGENYTLLIRDAQGRVFLVEGIFTSSIIAARTHVYNNGAITNVSGSGYKAGIFPQGRGIFEAIRITLQS